MLYLQCNVGRDRYVINAGHILSVIPLLKMHKMAGVPDYMLGFINYRGQTIPVVDLSKLLSGKRSKSRLSTRIVLIDYSHGDKHETVGLVAENATEVVKLSEDDFSPNIVDSESMPYLGAIANDGEGMLQKIDINGLIDFKVRDYLDWQAA